MSADQKFLAQSFISDNARLLGLAAEVTLTDLQQEERLLLRMEMQLQCGAWVGRFADSALEGQRETVAVARKHYETAKAQAMKALAVERQARNDA